MVTAAANRSLRRGNKAHHFPFTAPTSEEGRWMTYLSAASAPAPAIEHLGKPTSPYLSCEKRTTPYTLASARDSGCGCRTFGHAPLVYKTGRLGTEFRVITRCVALGKGSKGSRIRWICGAK